MNPLIYIIWGLANLLTLCYILYPKTTASLLSRVWSVFASKTAKSNLPAKKNKGNSSKNTPRYA